MKNSKKFIFAGIFGFAIITILFGFYTIGQISKISEISREIKEASEISQLVLDFNKENYHNQLELLKYAYEPNEKLLNIFERHNKSLHEHLEDLVKSGEAEENYRLQNPGKLAAISHEGFEKISKIADNLEKVHTDRITLLGELEKVKELGDLGYGDSNSANHQMYMTAWEKSKIFLIAHEAFFNTLEFNKVVNEFVEDQEDLTWKLQVHQESLISGFFTNFGILITILIIFNAAIAFSIIKLLKKRN